MSKVPCGGFKLDNNFLDMNENDELSLVGGGGKGKAYQQLVTDGEGNVKWEDRLAYDDSRVVVEFGESAKLVKVADELPSWASVDAPMKIWLNNGTNVTVNPEEYLNLGNGSFFAYEIAGFIATDNVEFGGVVFPKKGVYFLSENRDYVTGIASVDSDTPEITWDGYIGGFKKLDEKFLPDMNSIVINSSTSGSTKKFKITVDDSGTISATEVTS